MRLGPLASVAWAACVLALISSACVSGTTPDCSDAACGVDLGDAAPSLSDAGDAADGSMASVDASLSGDATKD